MQPSYGIGAFIEQKIHYGQMRHEAIFSGKHLVIRPFQSQVPKYMVRSFGMYAFPVIFTVFQAAGWSKFLRLPEFHGQPCLFQKKTYQLQIQTEKRWKTAVKYGEKLVFIIFEKSRCSVRRNDGTLMSGDPVRGVVHQDIPYGNIVMRTVLMDYGERKRLSAVSRIKMASVPV